MLFSMILQITKYMLLLAEETEGLQRMSERTPKWLLDFVAERNRRLSWWWSRVISRKAFD